jgi:hypothetical protein
VVLTYRRDAGPGYLHRMHAPGACWLPGAWPKAAPTKGREAKVGADGVAVTVSVNDCVAGLPTPLAAVMVSG